MLGDLIDKWSSWPEVWLVIGLVLCLLEIPTGAMIAFPLGLAAGIVSTYLFAQGYLPEAMRIDDWRFIWLAYAVLAVASVWILRRTLQKNADKRPDINEY